jgi:hypothetical protein
MSVDEEVLSALLSMQEEFHSHVAENKHAHAAIKGELERHREEEERVNRIVLGGNGGAGLSERMRLQERFSDNVRRLVWMMVPFLLVSTLALAWNVAVWYLRDGPP